MRPKLLLDVDGVLNVIDQTCEQRKVTLALKPHESLSRFESCDFFPVANARKLLDLAWKHFDVTWLTAWLAEANAIARWAGLEERPFLDGRRSGHPTDWKAGAVLEALPTLKGPVAWIEDGISEAAQEIVRQQGWTFLRCNTRIGVTGDHLAALEKFARENS